jgi:hypothetical protein
MISKTIFKTINNLHNLYAKSYPLTLDSLERVWYGDTIKNA